MRCRWRAQSIACFDTRPPTAEEHLRNTLSALANLAAGDGIKPRHETRVLDHKGHELSGVAANTEEFKIILLDEFLKSRVGGYTDSVTVCVFEYFSKCNKWLDITSRANNLNDNVELWRGGLTRKTTKAWGYVCGREVNWLGFNSDLTFDSWCE